MNSYEQIIKLIYTYIHDKENAKVSEKFCNAYMDMFFQLSDELEKALPHKKFEMLDDLNLLCDSYEKEPDIRQDDNYCIDEKQLKEKTIILYNNLNR